MYGIVNKSLKNLICSKYSEQIWQTIALNAGLENDVFAGMESYPDALTYTLVGGAAETLGLSLEAVLEEFGYYWATETAQKEYPELLESGGSTLVDFLTNLPNFHTQIVLMMPELRPPEFSCSDIQTHQMKLHYYSHREGLNAFVVGIIKGLGDIYQNPVSIQLLPHESQKNHTVFQLKWST